jgi:hypothetical protein
MRPKDGAAANPVNQVIRGTDLWRSLYRRLGALPGSIEVWGVLRALIPVGTGQGFGHCGHQTGRYTNGGG